MTASSVKFAALVVYLSVFGGAIGVFAKMALGAFTPLTIIFFRLFISLIFFVILLLLQKRFVSAVKAMTKNWGKFFILSFSGVLAAMVIGFVGLGYTTAMNYGLIYNLSSIFILIFSVALLHQRARPIDLLFIVLAFVGAGIIATNGSLDIDLSQQHFLGDFLVLISAIGWALYSVLGAKFTKEDPGLDSLVMNFGTFLIAATLIFPVLFFTRDFGINFAAINTEAIFGLLGLSVFSTAILFVLWLKFVDTEGGIWATLVSLSENLSGVILPIIFLGEQLTIPILLGGALMIVSVCGKELSDKLTA